MIPVRYDGFSPIPRLEKLDLTKNLLPNLLAELCSTAFINCY